MHKSPIADGQLMVGNFVAAIAAAPSFAFINVFLAGESMYALYHFNKRMYTAIPIRHRHRHMHTHRTMVIIILAIDILRFDHLPFTRYMLNDSRFVLTNMNE